MTWNKIEKTYHMDEKNFCDKHNCKMTHVSCSMYVYCAKCHQEQQIATLDRSGEDPRQYEQPLLIPRITKDLNPPWKYNEPLESEN